jgi:hypothetical protein
VHFEIVHEFDIPLDAVELAFLSPTLVDNLRPRLTNIETVSQTEHRLADGVLERVWNYQPNVKLPDFAKKYVTPEMIAWQERSIYRLKNHASEWTIHANVKPEWQKYFAAQGKYSFVPLGAGRTKRIVSGDLELRVPVLGQVAERMILNEVKKTFEAEAATLRDLATLV